jgi:hypothetical protein
VTTLEVDSTSFSWNKILPSKKFLVKDGAINSVTWVFRTGGHQKFERIRIKLSHSDLVPGLVLGFQDISSPGTLTPGLVPGLTPGLFSHPVFPS